MEQSQMIRRRDTSLSFTFLMMLVLIWFPLCYAGLWLTLKSAVFQTEEAQTAFIYATMIFMFAPIVYKAFFGIGKVPRTADIDIDRLPTLESLSTDHWSVEEQAQFKIAVDGILTADWMICATRTPESASRQHVATAFAFAAFSTLRRELKLASCDDIARDNPGRRSP